MVKITEIKRTATFAWSSDSLPLLATGTVAGAVDASFTSSSSLEVWDIFLNKYEPVFSADVTNRFYALAWSKPFEGRPKGLLAGAFEDGSVEFWDAETLIKSKDLEKASVHKSNKHSGPVKTLAFNPLQDHVLVTAGANGQIFIWDTKTFAEPTHPGTAMTPMDEVTSVAWNNSVSHIFASTGSGGYTSIWDLKSKREVLHLQYSGPTGRANFSHVAWHPTQSTKLVTASDNDACPLILTWDLRNSNAPEKILEGHKKGVLSLDWCRQDPDLLISSGKDNSTFLWNPVTGEKLGEYPTTANWAFQTKFAPVAPDVFATASFDGKVTVQSLQDTSPPVSHKVTSNDDNVFWSQISSTETQQPVFDVQQAPNWLKRPTSVSFGFGSKLVSIKKDESGKSIVEVQKFTTKNSATSSAFFDALKSNDIKSILSTKLESDLFNKSDKSDWELLKTLSDSGKDQIFGEPSQAEVKEEVKDQPTQDTEAPGAEDSFFENLGNGTITPQEDKYFPTGSFKIINKKDSAEKKKLFKLVLNNKIEDAVSTCLKEDKLIEALVLALDGSEAVKQQAKEAYFKKNSDDRFARVLYSVSAKNVSDIVENADVSNWKEIAASIAAFADSSDYDEKITALGDRVLASGKDQRDNAIKCYLAGNALDKIAKIWLEELPEFESELLSLKSDSVTSPSDARLESLTNFVQKIVTYRSISNITGVLSGPSIEPIANTILEYANLVAGAGEFELAEKFLHLLPSEFAGTEKDRINKATTSSTTSTAPSPIVKKTRTAAGRNQYGRAAATPAFAPVTSPNPTTIKPFVPAPSGPIIPGIPNAQGAPRPSYPGQPNVPAVQAVPATTNPYARALANPYAPLANVAQVSPAVINPPPIAPTKSYKEETDGWNDLPETFKPKSAPRRAAATAAAAVVSPSNTPFSPQTAGFPTPGSVAPPKAGSRTPSINSVPVSKEPRPAPVHLNNRYAPKASEVPSTPPVGGSGFSSPPVSNAPQPPKKNPYAPTATSSPRVGSPFAPPAHSAFVPPPTQPAYSPASPASAPSAPPKNPYAPPPSNGVNSTGIVPPPRHGSSFAPSPQPGLSGPPQGGFAPPPPQGGFAPPPQSIAPPPSQLAPSPAGLKLNPGAPPATPPAAPPAAAKHPKGDRSHIPPKSLPIFESLSKVHEAIKPSIPEKYARHGQDMEQRLNFLFDHLNNEDLLSDTTIDSLKQLSSALEAKDFATANALNVDIATKHSDELGDWHTGVKRLITMAEAMY